MGTEKLIAWLDFTFMPGNRALQESSHRDPFSLALCEEQQETHDPGEDPYLTILAPQSDSQSPELRETNFCDL